MNTKMFLGGIGAILFAVLMALWNIKAWNQEGLFKNLARFDSILTIVMFTILGILLIIHSFH